MCFSAATSSVKGPGQHKFGFEDGAGLLDDPIQRCRHPSVDGMPDSLLDVLDGLTRTALVPGAVEFFCGRPKLDDQVL